MTAVDAINRNYSMKGHRIDPSTGRSYLDGWDRPELEKVAGQRGLTVEQLLAEAAVEDRKRLVRERDARVAAMAQRIQDSTIGGLVVSSHGRQDRYLPWHLPWTEKNGITVVHDVVRTSQALRDAHLADWPVGLVPALFRKGGRVLKADDHSFHNPRLIVRQPVPAIVERLRAIGEQASLSEAAIARRVRPFEVPWVLGQTRNRHWTPLSAERMALVGDSIRKAGESTDIGEIPVETAGWLRGGSWVFMTFRVGDTRYVLGEDPTDYYLSFHSYFTGADANFVGITRVRELCDNTFQIGEARADALVRFDHRGGEDVVEAKLRAGIDTVMRAVGFIDADMRDAERLAAIDVTIARFEDLMSKVVADSEARAADKRRRLVETYATSPTLANLGFNGWRAEQAVIEGTQWLDSLRAPNARLMSVWDARGDTQIRTKLVRRLLLGGRGGGAAAPVSA